MHIYVHIHTINYTYKHPFIHTNIHQIFRVNTNLLNHTSTHTFHIHCHMLTLSSNRLLQLTKYVNNIVHIKKDNHHFHYKESIQHTYKRQSD